MLCFLRSTELVLQNCACKWDHPNTFDIYEYIRIIKLLRGSWYLTDDWVVGN